MPANQQYPLTCTLAAGVETDLVCPSTGGMTMNRGAAFNFTVAPTSTPTTDAVTIKVYVRTTSGGANGAGGAIANPDTYAQEATVYVLPVGFTAALRVGMPLVGEAVRVTGTSPTGPQTVSVSAAAVW